MMQPQIDQVTQQIKQNGQSYEFTGHVCCPLFKGESKLILDRVGLHLTSPFDQMTLTYGEIVQFYIRDHKMLLETAFSAAVPAGKP